MKTRPCLVVLWSQELPRHLLCGAEKHLVIVIVRNRSLARINRISTSPDTPSRLRLHLNSLGDDSLILTASTLHCASHSRSIRSVSQRTFNNVISRTRSLARGAKCRPAALYLYNHRHLPERCVRLITKYTENTVEDITGCGCRGGVTSAVNT
jgi:hypothetical protein